MSSRVSKDLKQSLGSEDPPGGSPKSNTSKLTEVQMTESNSVILSSSNDGSKPLSETNNFKGSNGALATQDKTTSKNTSLIPESNWTPEEFQKFIVEGDYNFQTSFKKKLLKNKKNSSSASSIDEFISFKDNSEIATQQDETIEKINKVLKIQENQKTLKNSNKNPKKKTNKSNIAKTPIPSNIDSIFNSHKKIDPNNRFDLSFKIFFKNGNYQSPDQLQELFIKFNSNLSSDEDFANLSKIISKIEIGVNPIMVTPPRIAWYDDTEPENNNHAHVTFSLPPEIKDTELINKMKAIFLTSANDFPFYILDDHNNQYQRLTILQINYPSYLNMGYSKSLTNKLLSPYGEIVFESTDESQDSNFADEHTFLGCPRTEEDTKKESFLDIPQPVQLTFFNRCQGRKDLPPFLKRKIQSYFNNLTTQNEIHNSIERNRNNPRNLNRRRDDISISSVFTTTIQDDVNLPSIDRPSGNPSPKKKNRNSFPLENSNITNKALTHPLENSNSDTSNKDPKRKGFLSSIMNNFSTATTQTTTIIEEAITEDSTGSIRQELLQYPNVIKYIFHPTPIWDNNPQLTYDFYIYSIHQRIRQLHPLIIQLRKLSQKQLSHNLQDPEFHNDLNNLSKNYKKLRLRFAKHKSNDIHLTQDQTTESILQYQELFNHSSIMSDPVISSKFKAFTNNINDYLNPQEQQHLTKDFTSKEIYTHLSKLISNGYSSPGYDALTYQAWFKSWSYTNEMILCGISYQPFPPQQIEEAALVIGPTPPPFDNLQLENLHLHNNSQTSTLIQYSSSSSIEPHNIKTLAFADDVIIFNKGERDLQKSFKIINEFSEISNLYMNNSKSKIYLNEYSIPSIQNFVN
ncbi:hypothetical protein C6P40_003876, partial [Pichia californica]